VSSIDPTPKPKRSIAKGIVYSVLALVVAILAIVAISNVGSKPTAQPSSSAPANPAPNADNNAPLPAGSTGTADTPAPAGPTVLPVGQPADITQDGSDAATVTVKSVNVTTMPADPEFGSPPANGYYVIVEVSASTLPGYTQGFDVNALDFYALSHGRHFEQDNGNAYDALSDTQSNQDVTATLGAGQTSTGFIAFDVTRPHGTIVYAPNFDGQPLAEWRY